MADREHYHLTIEDATQRCGSPPASIRLRRLLKAMLRTYGFRCLAIEPVENPNRNATGDTLQEGDPCPF